MNWELHVAHDAGPMQQPINKSKTLHNITGMIQLRWNIYSHIFMGHTMTFYIFWTITCDGYAHYISVLRVLFIAMQCNGSPYILCCDTVIINVLSYELYPHEMNRSFHTIISLLMYLCWCKRVWKSSQNIIKIIVVQMQEINIINWLYSSK